MRPTLPQRHGLRGLVQRPGRWLVNALGITSGDVPDQLDRLIVPNVDMIQSGLAQARWRSFTVVGSIAGSAGFDITNPAEVSPDFAHMFRIAFSNPGTAAVTCRARVNEQVTGGVIQELLRVQIAAGQEAPCYGSTSDPTSWVAHSGQQFIYVPPNYFASTLLGQFATNPGSATILVARMPAGTRPW